MKKMNWKTCLAQTASIALTLSLLAGITAQAAGPLSFENTAAGTVRLSIDPEIEVEYDKNGLVLEIEGTDDHGRAVVKQLKDYQGKDCRAVMRELIRELYEAGYFEKTVDGRPQNIVLKLDDDAVYLGDAFLAEMADSVREALRELGLDAQAVTVRKDELDSQGRLSLEKAKELVLAQLGLTTATFCDHEYDLEDGVYEFEFIVDGVKYEYEVDANTGEVLEADIEGNDDWNDRDDWDDWNEFDRPDEDDQEDDDLDEDDWDDLDDDDDDLGEDEDDRCEIDDDEDDLDEDDDDEDQDD